MGNQSSLPLVDDVTPPQTLERRDIESVAEYIKGSNVPRIVVLVRKPVHDTRRCGIPDFLSSCSLTTSFIRPERESALLRAFLTSAPRTLASTPTSPV